MAFIMGSQFKKLREAAKNGDERAKNILKMQLDSNDDKSINNSINEYFKKAEDPVQPIMDLKEENIDDDENAFDSSLINTGNKRLDKFLIDNRIAPDNEDYNEFVSDFYEMFPNEKNINQDLKGQDNVLQISENENIEDEIENKKPPLDPSIIPNNMGINLCSVENETWEKQPDGQLKKIEVNFKPENNEDKVEKLENIETHEESGIETGSLSDVLDFLLNDENEAIDGYDKAIKAVANETKLDEMQKNSVLATFQHIKEEELEHIKELQEIQKSIIMKVDVE